MHGSNPKRIKNGKTYNWCPAGQCRMCDDEWAARYGMPQRTIVNQPATSYSYEWSYQWRQVCRNGVCSTERVRVQAPQTVSRVVTTTKPAATVKPAQAASKPEDVDKMLAMLNLTPDDYLGEIGCGDGRICIRAAELYGVRCVGIEIDPVKAAEARRNVLTAVASHRIADGSVEIITGDAAKMTPMTISAAVVYLFPDTLDELRPVLRRIPRVVSSQHPIPGMVADVERDGLYLYRNERPKPVVTRPTVRRVGAIQIVE